LKKFSTVLSYLTVPLLTPYNYEPSLIPGLTTHRLDYQLESSHSPQVPPPRQSYSPGGITIFALPAVPLCPL